MFRKTSKFIFLTGVLVSSCTHRNQEFLPLKDDFEDIFTEYRDTNFIYTKEEMMEIRDNLCKILKKEGEKW